MTPKVATHVDGKPRRIVDTLAASPWAVMHFKNITAPMRELVTTMNIRAAESILKSRSHVVFADEVVSGFGNPVVHQAVSDAWSQTPGVMPPFDSMFVEAEAWDYIERRGFLVHGKTLDMDEEWDDDRPDDRDRIIMQLAEHRRPEVRAVIVCLVWMRLVDGDVLGPVSEFHYFVDRQFKIMRYADPNDATADRGIDNRLVDKPIVMSSPIGRIAAEMDNGVPFNAFIRLTGAVFVRTCGLMNASNIKLVDGGVTNYGVSRKRRDAGRLAQVKYSVLRLKVGTKLVPLDRAGGDGTGGGEAMHVVRGHFKDFSEKGLFGRYKGERYSHIWVPQFVKGNPAHGVTVHDYEQTAEPAAGPG